MNYRLLSLLVLITLIFTISLLHAKKDFSNSRDPYMEELSQRYYRPNWAPVPVFRGQAIGIKKIEKLIKSKNSQDRARTAFLLGQIADPSSIDILKSALKDPNRNVRIQAGIALSLMGNILGRGTCKAAMSTETEWVRYYAVYGLWNLRDKKTLRESLNNQPDFVYNIIQSALKTKHVKSPIVKVKDKNHNKPLVAKEVWNEVGQIFDRESDWWFHRGNYAQSIRCNEVNIFFNPESVDSYAVAAWLQWSSGNDKQAIELLKRGTKNNPENPEAYYELGYHYFNTKRYTLAEDPLSKAVELGGSLQTRKTYAHCLDKLKKATQSLAVWERLKQNFPDDEVVKKNLERLKLLTEQ